MRKNKKLDIIFTGPALHAKRPSPQARGESQHHPRSFAGLEKDEIMNVSLTFPDGTIREYAAALTGMALAEGISKSLGKKSVAYALNGVIRDLCDPLGASGAVEIITRDDKRALELIRHDCAHVMAEAVQELFPGTQATIGPVIENGFYYDFAKDTPFTPEDLPVIEKKMRDIIARNKPFTKQVWTREKARQVFAEKGEKYKIELIDAIKSGEDLKIYAQGDWFDLCRGPHMASTGQIGTAFKLMKVAGAYWRGDSNNPMLSRIYATAWHTQEELDSYINMLEEAEKRDHRKVGREMDLFHFQEEGPGVVFWHPKGWKMFQNLVSYMRRRLDTEGYDEVNAPQVLDKSLWETSGHWGWYQENMFAVKSAHAFTNPDDKDADQRIFALKPMNCPGHVQIFKHGLKSYRDLPIKLAEFGNVHRYEPSGALHGLMRVRGFTQDDAHIFCMEDQLAAECMRINNLILTTYADFGFSGITVKLSTRPEKRVGSDENWDHAEVIMSDVLKRIEHESGGTIKTMINPGEGAFYGPKFEYVLRDAIGRDWQCGTTQVDFNLPERFGAFYIDHESNKKQPVMVHRAICGSMERFLGILIENYAGHMPLWFAPLQVVVASITSDADEYCHEVRKLLKSVGILAEVDIRNEKINYKVREHSLAKVPVMLVCGKREAEDRTVNIRRLGSRDQTEMSLVETITALIAEATPPDIKRQKLAVG
jgi:threonyl-tRNA synthetase